MQNDFFDLSEGNTKFFGYIDFLSLQEKKLCVTGDLLNFLSDYRDANAGDGDTLKPLIEKIQESLLTSTAFYCNVREKIADSKFFRINFTDWAIDEISAKHYLIAKETFVNPEAGNNLLTLNFKPFHDKSPSVRDTKYIGTGAEYLNRYLSSQMFNETSKWREILFRFIQVHKYGAQQLILNDRIKSPEMLNENIDTAIGKLKELKPDSDFENFKHELQELGFEKGLGRTAGRVIESLEMLDRLLNSPDHNALMNFISRVPMIFKIAIVSTHGFFAQDNVLGLPDTGGQVVYILDQVKALEKTLLESQKASGLDITPKIIILTRLIPNAKGTTCNKKLEKVRGTKNAWILRIPFREHNKKVTQDWISRFEIWPYLEEFAEDAYVHLMAEFGGQPDLIIGNYSDGNLVARLLAKSFRVTQCCIAHALEKSKYLFSALYWKDLEQYYNFSMQFTADLIAINSADFLITSSFQEIAGTENTIGQYESYVNFTMPDLYRVENGINLFHTKFNIVSPGVDEKIFFRNTKREKRNKHMESALTELLFGNKEDTDTLGRLANPELTPIFSMARLDRIKNLTTLVKIFGESEELRKECNLIIVAGKVDPSSTTDHEEKEQIEMMHDLINRYNLGDNFRWVGKLFRKDQTGEVYRIIADHRGIFVQPALFEGFGLTVLEAMISGLPVFATKYGGPREIIQNRISGFHIDPINTSETTDKIISFIKEIKQDPGAWDEISKNAVKRVNEKYNWRLYSERLLSLAKIYGFWKFASNMERGDMEAYLDIIYHTIYKPRTKRLLEIHESR